MPGIFPHTALRLAFFSLLFLLFRGQIYGFEGEVKHKYDDLTMSLFMQVTAMLPLSCSVQLCVCVRPP